MPSARCNLAQKYSYLNDILAIHALIIRSEEAPRANRSL
jgi:hypothetical protein